MFQRPPRASRNWSSAPGRSGNSNRQTRSAATCGRVPADHVPDVELGHLVGRQIGGFVAEAAQTRGDRLAMMPRLGRDADEDLRLVAAAETVVEFGDDAPAERGAELAERAGPLGNRHGQQRLASFAELGTLGDEAQPIEVHVRAAQHRRQPLPLHRAGLDPRLQARQRERAGRLHDRPGVVEDVLDGRADFVVGDADDPVDRGLGDREGVLADLLHGDAVGEQADLIQLHAMAGLDRLRHRVGVNGLDADHVHPRFERLHARADAGDQAASADRHEHGGQIVRALPQQLHRRPCPVRR